MLGVFSAKEHFCIVPHPWQPATSAWDDNTVEIQLPENGITVANDEELIAADTDS